MFKNKKYSFIFSIFTAMATGVICSFLLISGVRIAFGFSSFPKSSYIFEYHSQVFDMASVIGGLEIVDHTREVLSGNRKDEISASSYIVINIDEGNKVLLEKDADTLLPVASVTKLVTAVVALRLMEKDKKIEITKNMLSTEGNTGRLKLGEKLSVSELLFPLLMVSSNDAAEALARSYGRENFVKEMNNWTNSIGAYRTYFKDPSGLSSQNVSTARDISIIASWIENNMKDVLDITHLKSKTVRTHTWTNPTHFLNLSIYVGGKNGYTPEANRTGLAFFKLGNPESTYAVVLLGSSYRDEDTIDVLDAALLK